VHRIQIDFTKRTREKWFTRVYYAKGSVMLWDSRDLRQKIRRLFGIISSQRVMTSSAKLETFRDDIFFFESPDPKSLPLFGVMFFFA
jgi:hypothetical protein